MQTIEYDADEDDDVFFAAAVPKQTTQRQSDGLVQRAACGGDGRGLRDLPRPASAMTSATEHASCPVSSSTLRVRRHRERRSHGLRLLTVAVPETVIEVAVARGLLASEERAEPWAVIQGCYASQLSDAALDRLVNGGVITHEQRGNAGAILRNISRWLEHSA